MLKIKNDSSTSKEEILKQFAERRPLPMTAPEFDTWAERIISGALVPADKDSQLFALADMLTHLGPTESHKEDAFFIHCLRKFAVNEVAVAKRKELYYKRHPEKAAELEKQKAESEAAVEKRLDKVGSFAQ